MKPAAKLISVTILDREYNVACPDGQEHELQKAARFLDKKMQEIKSSGKVFGMERIAVMAALNLTHELLHQDEVDNTESVEIEKMTQKIDQVLGSGRQLEL